MINLSHSCEKLQGVARDKIVPAIQTGFAGLEILNKIKRI